MTDRVAAAVALMQRDQRPVVDQVIARLKAEGIIQSDDPQPDTATEE